MADVGETAPDFTLPQDGGDDVTLSALRPAPVVLYFYPKDDTSGCTKEAIAFSGLMGEFEALGVKVFGVSKDPIKKHEKFRTKHELTVPLLSDEDSDVCEKFGVWVEKKMYGKTYMGIERATFLVDGSGTLANVWRKVKVPGHAEAVLETAKALGSAKEAAE
ncbi:MAG: thioredoxin-dependent thiol peroxidase [Pseudomonadota bacterium]